MLQHVYIYMYIYIYTYGHMDPEGLLYHPKPARLPTEAGKGSLITSRVFQDSKS